MCPEIRPRAFKRAKLYYHWEIGFKSFDLKPFYEVRPDFLKTDDRVQIDLVMTSKLPEWVEYYPVNQTMIIYEKIAE